MFMFESPSDSLGEIDRISIAQFNSSTYWLPPKLARKDLISRHAALLYDLIFLKLLPVLYSLEGVPACQSLNMHFWLIGISKFYAFCTLLPVKFIRAISLTQTSWQ